MANTPRLNLYKPVGNELCIVETAINDQMTIIDELLPVIISDTTPPASYVGREWWKADTKEFFLWSGSDWLAIDLITGGGPAPGPSGRKAFTVSSNATASNVTASTENTSPFIPTTFSATSGKKYEITMCGSIAATRISGSGDDLNGVHGVMNVRIASGASVNTAGTVISRVPVGQLDVFGTSALVNHTSLSVQWIAPSTGSFTVGLFLKRETGLGSADTVGFRATSYCALAVEEIG